MGDDERVRAIKTEFISLRLVLALHSSCRIISSRPTMGVASSFFLTLPCLRFFYSSTVFFFFFFLLLFFSRLYKLSHV
jgi:hypothetical protein